MWHWKISLLSNTTKNIGRNRKVLMEPSLVFCAFFVVVFLGGEGYNKAKIQSVEN